MDGVATGIALAWLEAGEVDAVVVAGSSEDGFGSPEPSCCRTKEDVLRGRRVKPSLCPSLAILDQVQGRRVHKKVALLRRRVFSSSFERHQ